MGKDCGQKKEKRELALRLARGGEREKERAKKGRGGRGARERQPRINGPWSAKSVGSPQAVSRRASRSHRVRLL